MSNAPTTSSERVYFPRLDALRFYAAMSVVIVHISNNFGELRTRPSHYALLNALAMDAQSAVNLFFVLSGFLITYLLLKEWSATGTLNIRSFYTRRALRIVPLYYLIALVGFVLLPSWLGPASALASPAKRQVVLVLLMLPNLVGPLGSLGHLWSIGLEMQYYLAWPWVIKRDILLKVAFGIVFLKAVLNPVVAAFNSDAMMQLFMALRFECMAMGAMGAYLYFYQHQSLKYLYSRPVKVAVLVGVVYVALKDVPLTTFGNLLTSVLFTLLILNISTGRRLAVRPDRSVFSQLGRLSYGIYMYHFPLLYATIFVLRERGVPEGHWFDLILYTVTIGGTLLLAILSYRWLETPLLRLKARFAIIQSQQ